MLGVRLRITSQLFVYLSDLASYSLLFFFKTDLYKGQNLVHWLYKILPCRTSPQGIGDNCASGDKRMQHTDQNY